MTSTEYVFFFLSGGFYHVIVWVSWSYGAKVDGGRGKGTDLLLHASCPLSSPGPNSAVHLLPPTQVPHLTILHIINTTFRLFFHRPTTTFILF